MINSSSSCSLLFLYSTVAVSFLFVIMNDRLQNYNDFFMLEINTNGQSNPSDDNKIHESGATQINASDKKNTGAWKE